MRLVPLVVTVLGGCVTVRDSEDLAFDSAGISVVSAVVEDGDFSYSAFAGDDIGVTATTWGRGSNKEKAAARRETVTWSAFVEVPALLLDGISPERLSGVDFDLIGPTVMSLDVVLDNGAAVLRDVEGVHTIAATSVTGDVLGDMVVFADSVNLAFVPYVATNTLIEATGSVTLAIPFGLSYDLTVRTSPEQAVTVTELGFQQVSLGEGFFNGYSGFGEVEIDINAGGSVDVVELF
jgi:hypothetical protein